MDQKTLRIAVAGGASCSSQLGELAFDVGSEIAKRGAILLCGGGLGVMERAASGARQAGGVTLGILPGASTSDSPPNSSIDIPIVTGLGQARNLVLVLSAHAVIAVGGDWGTLSEIALARKHGIPVVLLESWGELPDRVPNDPLLSIATSALDAVDTAMAAAQRGPRQ